MGLIQAVRGFYDGLIGKAPRGSKFAQTINGYSPIFSQYGSDIYESDVVQQAIFSIVSEMQKLNPRHIRKSLDGKSDSTGVIGSIQRMLDNPNPLMTTSEFLGKIIWNLYLNYNSFIYPTYSVLKNADGTESRVYNDIYPLQPTQVDFIEDASGKLYVKMRFPNNFETTLPYEDVIHIRFRYSYSEYMGGNEQGQPDHKALLKNLELNNQLLQGIGNAMRMSYAVNGVLKYNTQLNDEKMEAAITEFNKKLAESASGIIGMDNKGEFIQIKRELALVDKATLDFIDTKILRQFGVPIPILIGDYDKKTYESFYQKTLEPLIIAIGQAFTKKLFTPRERSFGNQIILYAKELVFMTMTEKLELGKTLGAAGGLYLNEFRGIFGMPPDPKFEGIIMQSLNWVDREFAKDYQLSQNKKTENSDNKGDDKNAENK